MRLNIKHKFPQFTSHVSYTYVYSFVYHSYPNNKTWEHSFNGFTVTLAGYLPILPTLQLRFIDKEKLKATETVICPFSPSVA